MLSKIILLFFITFFSTVYSKKRTKKEAQQVAYSFLLNEQTSVLKIASSLEGEVIENNKVGRFSLGSIYPINNNKGKTIAYLQKLLPHGFIVIYGDNALGSIIGFSYKGTILPSQIKGNPIFDIFKSNINTKEKAKLDGYLFNGEKQKSSISTTQWGPYIQTTWNQGGIFNEKCPYKIVNTTGRRRPTGCTAIAMAQIVNMHKYPKNLSFTYENDHYISKAAVKNKDGEIIEWDNIDIDGNSASYGFPTFDQLNNSLNHILYDNSEEEISNLCFGTGIKLKMRYGRLGSGAWRPGTYLDEFGYGSAIHSTNWDRVRDEVIQNMKEGLPVQIAIYNSDPEIKGGHSVIIDGYRDDGFFHINYGWGAKYPDPINTAWYNIPNMPYYNTVAMVIYDISVDQGWNQVGSDSRNSYHSIYPAPIAQPEQKWYINMPNLPDINKFNHLVIGTGGDIYTSIGINIQGDNYHPYIAIYNKFGTEKKLIEVTPSNVNIDYLCQNSEGEIFFQAGSGGTTATDSKIYRLNPNTEKIVKIFSHYNPDAGICDQPIKVDLEDYLYFIIQPRNSENYTKLYCIDHNGSERWAPYSFSNNTKFYMSTPTIDNANNKLFVNSFQSTEQSIGYSYMLALNLDDGSLLFNIKLPTDAHKTSKMAATASIGKDGTVFVDANNTLFALNSNDGSIKWQRTFKWRSNKPTPSIGTDGTVYVAYDDKVMALNQYNGSTKWEKQYVLGTYDYLGELYSSSNGIVVISYNKNGLPRLSGIKDNGNSYETLWDIQGGGTLAFGPGRTIYSIPTGNNKSIIALTDYGLKGDPEGKGMDFSDNSQPYKATIISPSNGAINQPTENVELSWTCSDPDGHPLKYDIYVATLIDSQEAALVPVTTQISGNTYTLHDLLPGTQYLWSVVATDGQDISNGPIWTFSTKGTYPNIIVSSPDSSSNWEIDKTYTITWDDNIDENVRIQLYKDSTLDTTLSASTNSDGLYEWSISNSIIPSNDYKIKISSINNSEISDFSESFTISKPTIITQSILLNKGWNLISLNVHSNDTSPQSVFQPIMSNLVQVKGLTESYDPTMPDYLNTLSVLVDGFAYWVKVKTNTILDVEGIQIDNLGTNIPINIGWNLIGYICQQQNDIDTALADIMSNVLQVKDLTKSYDPKVPSYLNTLNTMIPNDGYWIKSDATTNLLYPTPTNISKAVATNYKEKSSIIWMAKIYTNSMVFYGKLDLNDIKVAKNDIVGAFVNNECRGIGRIIEQNNKKFITIVIQGEKIENVNFKVYSLEKNQIYNLKCNLKFNPGLVISEPYIINDTNIDETINDKIPNLTQLFPSYPNPFNATTNILFSIHERTRAIINIYTINGELVRELENKSFEPGNYTISWDGKNGNNKICNSGVFLIRLKTSTTQMTQKIILLK